jgi:uncharacterized membrane protein
MSPRFAVALLVLLAVTASAVGGVAAQEGTPANGTDATVPPEETVIEIQLQADGDARWHVSERLVITDDAERAAFDDLGDDFEGGSAAPLGLDTVRRAAAETSSETDRSMAIQDVERSATREEGDFANVTALNGTYNLSFTWTNFAREDGENFVVHDAFRTDDGTWFGGLTADERLIIALPPGHGASTAPKAFEQNELRWEGPTSFEPGYLRIVYSGTLEPPNDPNGGLSLAWIALLVAAIASFAAGLLLVRRRDGSPVATVRDVLGSAVVVGGLDDENEEAALDEDAADDDDEDLELLSDEERVERLLEDNGGRMKQANIVKETGWSNAKVSQLLSSMEDEGRIAKLRIGRENLISFPDEDVGEFES